MVKEYEIEARLGDRGGILRCAQDDGGEGGGKRKRQNINAEVAEETQRTQSESRSLALLGMIRCWNGRQDAGIEEGSPR